MLTIKKFYIFYIYIHLIWPFALVNLHIKRNYSFPLTLVFCLFVVIQVPQHMSCWREKTYLPVHTHPACGVGPITQSEISSPRYYSSINLATYKQPYRVQFGLILMRVNWYITHARRIVVPPVRKILLCPRVESNFVSWPSCFKYHRLSLDMVSLLLLRSFLKYRHKNQYSSVLPVYFWGTIEPSRRKFNFNKANVFQKWNLLRKVMRPLTFEG